MVRDIGQVSVNAFVCRHDLPLRGVGRTALVM